MQIWNVYPKSGSAYKKERECFFREDLNQLMIQWKDDTRYVFQTGDHNCIHRAQDPFQNASQHLQQGLVSHLRTHGISDDFLKLH